MLMKNKALKFYLLFIVVMSFTSCEIISDIFNAGVGVGVFIVLAIVALVIFLISRMRRKG
jgi:uncharacterized membrane protein